VLAVMNGKRPRARLASIGAYSPDRVLSNQDLMEMVDTTDEWIVSRTGIKERRMAAPEQAASDLGIIAVQRALDAAGIGAEDVDSFICATSTGDYQFPPTAPIIALGVGAPGAAAYDLNVACAGWVYGLSQACAMVESGMARNVVLVGSEVLTRFVDFTDRGTCILFGDGAGAAVIQAVDDGAPSGFRGFDIGADATQTKELMIAVGGGRTPPRAGCFEDRDALIYMNGREVFKFATRIMVESTQRLLDAVEMSVDEVDLFIPHQANIRIIEYAMERLGIPSEKVFTNLERYGNTSAASIPIAMTEARDAGLLKPGDLVLMVGFGAGLTWGSTLVRYEPTVAA
jgi:3-oxoacyl-[acyl-carrier-protein] synthase III